MYLFLKNLNIYKNIKYDKIILIKKFFTNKLIFILKFISKINFNIIHI